MWQIVAAQPAPACPPGIPATAETRTSAAVDRKKRPKLNFLAPQKKPRRAAGAESHAGRHV
jgi:hypothetical protein